MKSIILVIFLSFSFIFAEDFLQEKEVDYIKPFIGIDNNVFSVDELNFDNEQYGFTAGWIIQEESKISISKFIGREKNELVRYKVDVVDLNYEYSFNNFGPQRGFTLSTGVERLTLTTDTTVTSTDVNATTSVESNIESSLNVLIGLGYEYKINSQYLLNAKHDIRVARIGASDNMKKIYNTKFSIKYIFE